ncbi:MAG: diaminopimelate decarboxylase [Rhodoluna sp.]
MNNPLAPAWLECPSDLNAINNDVFSRHTTRRATGELEIAGVAASDLSTRFGTPLYVIDEDDFRARATSAKNILSAAAEKIGATAKVYYASKALLSVEIAAWIDELGLNIDVASGGELAAALAAGIDASRIGLHGNNKSIREIGRAVTSGVGAIVIDSEIEIERIAAAAGAQDKVQNVRLRINTGVHGNTHDFLATAREDQKFGIPIADALALVEKIRSHSHLKFIGFHQHVGSQIFSADGFIESTKRLVELTAKAIDAGIEIAEMNLGGGFGVNYKPADNAPSLSHYADAIAEVVATECARHGIGIPVLAFEPGRYIAGPAGITLYNVGTTKDVKVTDGEKPAVRKYVSVDGGMSDNLRTSLYEAEYHAVLASRTSSADAALVRIVGKHCESGDIVVRNDYLPEDIQPNDLVAVATTGAYCFSLSNNYNYLTRPAVVAVRSGEARVIVRAETEADLFARDLKYQEVVGKSPAAKNEKS